MATGFSNNKRLSRKPTFIFFNHEEHEGHKGEFLICPACLCDLRVLRGDIITGGILL
jgi:hypothetical protein